MVMNDQMLALSTMAAMGSTLPQKVAPKARPCEQHDLTKLLKADAKRKRKLEKRVKV
jgi:hypothetical protein